MRTKSQKIKKRQIYKVFRHFNYKDKNIKYCYKILKELKSEI